MSKTLTAALAALALTLGSAATSSDAHAAPGSVPAYSKHTPAPKAPPARVAPSKYKVWVPGHFAFTAGKVIWVAGHFKLAPKAKAVWLPGHWEMRAGKRIWIKGRWS